jgi:sarcosine oxidase/L-pipecolate oxidase
MSTPKDQKILIIGTGTFGASTAYHLAQRGYTDITCIDKWPYPSLDSAGYDIVGTPHCLISNFTDTGPLPAE